MAEAFIITIMTKLNYLATVNMFSAVTRKMDVVNNKYEIIIVNYIANEIQRS